MKTEHILFALLRLAIYNKAINGNIKAACTPEGLEAVYTLAKKHDLTHLAANALEGMDLPEGETLSKFKTAKMRAIYRYARMDYDYEQLCQTLEAAEIPFIPLKGSILRQYYPEPWMRTSCDIDVLVHEADLDMAVQALVSQGWRAEKKRNYHDLSLYSPNNTHLELHFQLAENMENIDPVLKRVWEHSAPVEGKQYAHRQSNAFFLFHHLAHMSYHFVAGGCGIRPFLDLWIMNNRMEWEESTFRSLLKESRLEQFCESVWMLMNVWFDDQPHTLRTQKMEEYILSGGTYGNLSNKVLLAQARAGSGAKNTWQRIFQPYDQLCMQYPILKKHRYLTPLFQIVRWFRVLTTGRFRHSVQELKLNQSNSSDQVEDAKAFLADVGLAGIRRSTQVQD